MKLFRNTKSNSSIVQHAELLVALYLKPAGFNSLKKLLSVYPGENHSHIIDLRQFSALWTAERNWDNFTSALSWHFFFLSACARLPDLISFIFAIILLHFGQYGGVETVRSLVDRL